MKKVKALALFSGGLDSILASRLILAQGIDVIALKFVSPFFNYDVLLDPEQYKQEIRQKYGLEVMVVDISKEYLDLLHKPAHGFGKNFNPCVDCKIFMFTRAKEMMAELGASFLITGEVLGQRPMSQRRDTLNVIARDSDSRSILLRPLSAKLMDETEPEIQGLVDREQLLDFSGRGRSRQIALAKEFGITDFPSPAGGCVLADPILSKRIKRIYAGDFVFPPEELTTVDILMLLGGRQFLLPGGGWLILGRNEGENDRLEALAEAGDARLLMEVRPGPTAIVRRAAILYDDQQQRDHDLELAAALVVRYGKKEKNGPPKTDVDLHYEGKKKVLSVAPLADEIFTPWLIY